MHLNKFYLLILPLLVLLLGLSLLISSSQVLSYTLANKRVQKTKPDIQDQVFVTTSPIEEAAWSVVPSATVISKTPFPITGTVAKPTPSPTNTPAFLAGAGDISICGQDGDDQTASLLEEMPGAIFTTGDNSNEQGTMDQYQDCFDPSWGRHKDRIRPSAGNHDYETDNATEYFSYFGESAGSPGEGYYSYDTGDWHIVVLNSNCLSIDGCGPASSQAAWLKEDLERSLKDCTLAYWHHPRWTSGYYGDSDWLDTFWQILFDNGVELVLNGHDHFYERLAPQNPDGELDPEKGIRQITVGTGGVAHDPFYAMTKNSELQNNDDFGILKLSLFGDHYEWEFIPVEGGFFKDTGTDNCH